MRLPKSPPPLLRRRWLLAIAVLGAAVPASLLAGNAWRPEAPDDVVVGQRVRPNLRVSIDDIDHSDWGELLRSFVDDRGRVDYAGWQLSEEASVRLDQYLRLLSFADPDATASREGRLAFWINAYNALTIKGILREYPTSSIRNHTPRLFGYHIWENLKLQVGGHAFSLDEIEHEILRPMGDPRIHFAIVCASIGCPRLRAEEYSAANVDRLLEENSVDFFSRQDTYRFDARRGQFHLSRILDWFGDDFGANRVEQLKAIARWLPDGPGREAAAGGEGQIRFLEYDWSLNDQPPG